MEPTNALKAKTLALAIAIGVSGPATAVRDDELQDLKAQIGGKRGFAEISATAARMIGFHDSPFQSMDCR